MGNWLILRIGTVRFEKQTCEFKQHHFYRVNAGLLLSYDPKAPTQSAANLINGMQSGSYRMSDVLEELINLLKLEAY